MKLKPYPEYKDSGVPWLGKVPGHWVMLPGMAVLREKQVRNVGLEETTVLTLSYGQIKVRSQAKLHGLVPESFETYQVVDPTDIVVRPTDLQNDKVSLRVGKVKNKGIITSAYICVQPFGVIQPDYAYLLLHGLDLMKVFYGLGSGLRQNLSWLDFRRLSFFIPTKEEQAQIASFLDHKSAQIFRFIRAKKRMIELLKEQKQAIINDAVTGKIDVRTGKPYAKYRDSGVDWLGLMPEGWEVLPFTKHTTERADYRGATPEKVETGKFLVTAKNIGLGFIDYDCSKEYVRADQYDRIMRRGLPRIGDLLFTTEAPLGHAALVDNEDIAIAQRIIRFRFDENCLVPKFGLLAILSKYFQEQLVLRATGSTASGIKASKLPQLKILAPGTDQQNSIVEHTEHLGHGIDQLITRTTREISLIQEYRTRLISDVVTGKIDVRGIEVPDFVDTIQPEPPTEDDPDEVLEEAVESVE